MICLAPRDARGLIHLIAPPAGPATKEPGPRPGPRPCWGQKRQARGLGLEVHAGHGLHYHNVQRIAAIKAIRELNIGHAIMARALFTGLESAVAEMKRLMREARSR